MSSFLITYHYLRGFFGYFILTGCSIYAILYHSPKNRSIQTFGVFPYNLPKKGGVTMFGPLFQVGDEVIWNDEHPRGLLDIGSKQGPFVVNSIENNDDPDACGCGASRENGYVHFDDVEADDCCHELPSQWVTIKLKDGEVLKDHEGKLATFASDWFRKA